MKLTNTIRSAFIRSVMNDVPQIDYDEQVRAQAVAAAIKAMPPKVRAVYEDEALRDEYLGGDHYLQVQAGPGSRIGVSIPIRAALLPESVIKALEKLGAKKAAQEKKRQELQSRLSGAAYAVHTRKALAELLPEFEKYLPADDAAANRTLPVVANIVAEFTKAGWPQGKQQTDVAA